MKSKVKVQIFVATNKEWGFRVIRGARIILGPEETYKLRGGVRRAVRSFMDISSAYGQDGQFFGSRLAMACAAELDAEQARWNNRKRKAI